MHDPYNVKFINAQQEKQTYKYKNSKEKLYKNAIWYNKSCRQKKKVHLIGSYNVKIACCLTLSQTT